MCKLSRLSAGARVARRRILQSQALLLSQKGPHASRCICVMPTHAAVEFCARSRSPSVRPSCMSTSLVLCGFTVAPRPQITRCKKWEAKNISSCGNPQNTNPLCQRESCMCVVCLGCVSLETILQVGMRESVGRVNPGRLLPPGCQGVM